MPAISPNFPKKYQPGLSRLKEISAKVEILTAKLQPLLVQIAKKILARTSPKNGLAGIDHTACMCY